jgi:GNAT superfamily N-acetyltransferase
MELGLDYTIRELHSADCLNSFSMGDAKFTPLKSFLLNQAVNFHNKSIAKTYVAVRLQNTDEGLIEDPNLSVFGYITLICSEIDIRNGYDLQDCPYANNYESLPAVKIARLAVDKRYRNKGIGDNLVILAIAIATDNISPVIGCRFITTDAKSEAVKFYEKAGFTLLDTAINRAESAPIMFLDILKTNFTD